MGWAVVWRRLSPAGHKGVSPFEGDQTYRISLEGMMLKKLKLQYFVHLCEELTHGKDY